MTAANTPDTVANTVQVLAFDIFGTVVDWHGSIAREVRALYPQVDADAFALAWRAGYQPAMARVMRGEQGWTLIDALHRQILDEILPRFGLSHLGEAERQHLNRVWHRLHAWPDSVQGLTRHQFKTVFNKLLVFAKNSTLQNLIPSVHGIAEQGVSNMFHVRPDLVCTTGFQLALYQRNIIKPFQHLIVRYRPFPLFGIVIY